MIARSVVLADDHPVFRHGLRAVIEAAGRFRIVAEANDGEEAIRALAAHAPDFAVIDLAMPGKDGFEVARWAAARCPDTRLVLLTLYRSVAYVDRALALGIAGYVVKDDAGDEIMRCLDAVAGGEFYTSPNITRPAAKPPETSTESVEEIAKLTPTQRAIVRLLAHYQTSREIGAQLGISAKTVENHRSNIAQRMNLRGPNALLRFAVSNRDLLNR